MKKIIFKIIITLLILSTSAFSASTLNTKSLVAIEGSYNSFNISEDGAESEKIIHGGFGVKIGSQTDNYRLFLSARNKAIPDYNYAYTLGAEIQYLMNFSSVANIFIGVNSGYFHLKIDDESELNTKYIGGDIGLNLHLSEKADLEIGTRTIKLDDSLHLSNGVIHEFDNITSVYVSFIFKYSMDER